MTGKNTENKGESKEILTQRERFLFLVRLAGKVTAAVQCVKWQQRGSGAV